MRKVVIIGNGISGITCARNIRKMSDDQITVISSETDHFFSRTALMYIYMGHMKYEHTKPYEDFFWAKNRINLVRGTVTSVDPGNKKILLNGIDEIYFDVLVIATGSVTQKFDWPGQDLRGVQGLYSLQDLEAMELLTKGISHAVIIGGGLIGVEMAEMLHSRKVRVTMLVKDKYYWAGVLPSHDGLLVSSHIEKHGIELKYNTHLKEIIGGSDGTVKQIRTSDGDTIDCEFVGVATGVKPNVDFLRSSGISIKKGVLVNNYFETNLADVYAIGDCAEFQQPVVGRKNLEQVWYTGRMHGETLAHTICGRRTPYTPGPWFNSAKFFDLEYQTYGVVSPVCNEEQQYFFWRHPKKEIALGVFFERQDRRLLAVNCYGMRLKHSKFDEWIKTGRSADYVLSNLHQALFNPEFSKDHSEAIISEFNDVTAGCAKAKRRYKFSFNFKTRS